MISILIPVYNTDKILLQNSINSCLSQTFNDYEIIIINNGSNNNETLKILEKYSKNNKIKIYDCERQDNKKNISVALNFGLQKCNYNLIARMDSDDIMHSERLYKQYKYITDNDVDILGGQIIINNKEATSHPAIITKKIAANSTWFINHPTVMFKKDKILSIGGYKDEPVYLAEDYELWLRCLSSDMSIHNLLDIILFYYQHNNNETQKTQNMDSFYNYLNKLRMEFIQKNDIS